MQERVAFAHRLKSLISYSQEKSKVSFKNLKIRDSQLQCSLNNNTASSHLSSQPTQRTPKLQPSLQCSLCGAHSKQEPTLPLQDVGLDA